MGYIKLDRKTLEWEWFTDVSTSHLWVYILLKANHKPKAWRDIVVPVGSFVTSEAKMSAETGLSREQIRRALKNLLLSGQITKIATKTYTLINVIKWADYQCLAENATNITTNEPTLKPTLKPPTTKNIKKKRNIEYIGQTTSGRFVKPTLEEVRAYCQERNNGINPQRFMDYYDANGWKVGKNPMKDWKASIRTWENNSKPKDEPRKKSYEEEANEWKNF